MENEITTELVQPEPQVDTEALWTEFTFIVKQVAAKKGSRVKIGPAANRRLSELIAVFGPEKYQELLATESATVAAAIIQQAKPEAPIAPLPPVEPPKPVLSIKERLIKVWGAIKDADDKGALTRFMDTPLSNDEEAVYKSLFWILRDGDSRCALRKEFNK